MEALISYGYYVYKYNRFSYGIFLMEDYSIGKFFDWIRTNKDIYEDFHILYKEVFNGE